MIKIAKLNKILGVDLPTIGLETLKIVKKTNVNGIAYSANKTIFIKKQKIIDYCNKHKIFFIWYLENENSNFSNRGFWGFSCF